MIVISGPTGSGKTQKLAQEAQKVGGTIVSMYPNRTAEKLQAYGILGLNCISYKTFERLSKDEKFKGSVKAIYPNIFEFARSLEV